MQSTDADNPHSPELSSNSALTETEAALRLGLKVATLRAWRHQKRGSCSCSSGEQFDTCLLTLKYSCARTASLLTKRTLACDRRLQSRILQRLTRSLATLRTLWTLRFL